MQEQFPCVTSFLLSDGILLCARKKELLVPFTLFPTPCSRHPNSLAKYLPRVFHCLLRLMRFLYHNYSPVSPLIMELAIIFRYCLSGVPVCVVLACPRMCAGPTALYNFSDIFCFWWIICVPLG